MEKLILRNWKQIKEENKNWCQKTYLKWSVKKMELAVKRSVEDEYYKIFKLLKNSLKICFTVAVRKK